MPDGALRRVTTTPAWLRRFAAGLTVLTLLAGAASLWTLSGIADAARTIGRDAEPSVVLALQMQATLSDMDAAVLADSLTDNAAAAGTSNQYNEDLRRLTADLVLAAQNITYGEAEAGPIRALQRLLVQYEQAVVEARYIGRGDPAITTSRLEWASRVNRDMAIPEAQALAAANADQLDARYASYRATSLLLGTLTVLAFAALLATQIATQSWLTRRTRRRINPLLLAATLAAATGLAGLVTSVLAERADLRAAKSDAYDSLHVLYQAKGQVNALRAAASLWLLDPAAQPTAQAAMDDAATALVAAPGQLTTQRPRLLQALTLEQQGNAADARGATPALGGLLGAELANITFGVPEREAATLSVVRLDQALAEIRAVQALDGRQPVFAVTRWLTGSAAIFAGLQQALDKAIAVNQGEFDRRAGAALMAATTLPWAVALLVLAIIPLNLGGLWLRLREYR